MPNMDEIDHLPITNPEYASLYSIRESAMKGLLSGTSTFPGGNAGDIVTYTGTPGQYGTMIVDLVLNANSDAIPSSRAVWGAMVNVVANGNPVSPPDYHFNVQPNQLVTSINDTFFKGTTISPTITNVNSTNIPTIRAVSTYISNIVNNITVYEFDTQPDSIVTTGIDNTHFYSIPISSSLSNSSNIPTSYAVMNAIQTSINNISNSTYIINSLINQIIPSGNIGDLISFSGNNGEFSKYSVDQNVTLSPNIPTSHAVMNLLNEVANYVPIDNTSVNSLFDLWWSTPGNYVTP